MNPENYTYFLEKDYPWAYWHLDESGGLWYVYNFEWSLSELSLYEIITSSSIIYFKTRKEMDDYILENSK